MRFFRFRRRPTPSFPRQTWDMNRKRSPLLRIKQLFKGKFLIVLGVIILISLIIYSAFFTTLLSVRAVEVSTDNRDINLERLNTALNEQLVGKNELLLNITTLENTAYDQFPDISSMSCSRNFFRRTIACAALGYELVAVINHEGNKYYINENGVVIGYDARKLGLPVFDLILNPVFAEIAERGKETTAVEEPLIAAGPVLPEQPKEDPAPQTPGPTSKTLLFLPPSQDPPIEPLQIREARSVFEVTVGKKILESKELKLILEAIKSLESIMQRRVIHAQYVQVAGELSLTSKQQPATPKDPNAPEDPDAPKPPETPSSEPIDHEFTVLLDLRRNLDDQFKKLVKAKDVIDFSEVSRIDLSIDGEKVFYR